ncbi:MAG TPA: YfhO family protein, partial [Bacteroidota bacterium]|nr:YfhO family protein [Bacteroidota bacterium]
LLMSFGKHFGIFYELLFTTLPFFNKFRAPAMILHLLAFSVAVLGAFGLQVLLERKEYAQAKLTKGLLYALGAIGIVLLLGLVMRSSLFELFGFTFAREGENYGAQVMTQLKNIRFEVLWTDYIKFVFIAGAAIGAVLLYVSGRFGETGLSAALIAILVVDLFIIDSKFIDPKPQVELEQSFQPDATVQFLKQQPGLSRVFPLGDLYGETAYAYHGLQSVGGYSPAKLKIYQTVVDSCFFRGPDPAFPLNMNIVNMLNAKYVLAQGQLPADRFRHVFTDQATGVMTYENPSVLPRAWFVQKALVAQSDAEVFALLNSREFNPATSAILQKPLTETVASPGNDASVEVTEYRSRTIKLRARTSVPALMVLSEIYYPAGWKAFIDGQPTEIYRTNSILRSIVVPAGSHEIVFRFDPLMYELGWDLTHAGWGVAALCILMGLWRTPGVRERLLARKRREG